MSLKLFVDDIQTVEETVRPYYEQTDDGWRLSLETPVVPKVKLDEFRSTNIELSKKLKNYEGIDIEEYKRLKNQPSNVNVDEIVGQRIGQLQKEWQDREADLTARLTAAQQRASTLTLESRVLSAAQAAGVRSTAVEDVMGRAARVWQVDEKGQLVARDANGEPVYERDGTTLLTVDTWLKQLNKNAPHLFEQNSGVESRGSRQPTNSASEPTSSFDLYAQGLKKLGIK